MDHKVAKDITSVASRFNLNDKKAIVRQEAGIGKATATAFAELAPWSNIVHVGIGQFCEFNFTRHGVETPGNNTVCFDEQRRNPSGGCIRSDLR